MVKVTCAGYLPALFVGMNKILSMAQAVFTEHTISIDALTIICNIVGRTKHWERKQGLY